MAVSVSQHAIDRYRERVADGSDGEIIAALSGPCFDLVASMGRGAVILSCGARAIVEDGSVVTVLRPKRRVMNWGRH